MARVRRGPLVVAAALALVLVTPGLGVPHAARARSFAPPRTVVLVLAPYVTWDDIGPDSTPALARLARDGALACVNVRMGSLDRAPDDARGAAVIAAGHPLQPAVRENESPEPTGGTLGDAVRRAGGLTVAIGSSARSRDEAATEQPSSAALVAGDSTGKVDIALTGEAALRADGAAPLGIAADLGAMERAYRAALEQVSTGGRPALVVLDTGDGARAREAAASGADWEAAREGAVASADALVALAARWLPDDAVLVVVSTAQYAPGATEGFGPLLAAGLGQGVFHSSSTRRHGVAVLSDVTATCLHALGVDLPPQVAGAALTAEPLSADRAALEVVRRIDACARALEALRAPVGLSSLGLQVRTWWLLIGLVGPWYVAALIAAAVPRRARSRRVGRVLATALLVCLAVPVGTFLARLGGCPGDARAAWAQLAVGVLLASGITVAAAWRRGLAWGLATVSVLTVALLLVDQLLGAPLSYGSALSYSPLFGARFYGIGNEGAAVLVGAALVAAGALSELRWRTRAMPELLLGGPVVVAAVAPFLGANVGVAAWGTIAFVAMWAYRTRRRVTWRLAVASLLAVALLVVLSALADALVGTPSHLGGFVRSAGADGGSVVQMVARKVAINVGILGATPLVWILPVLMALVAYALMRPRGAVADLVGEHRGFAGALVGALAGALVGALTEDSGVVVSALVLLYGLGASLAVLLADPRGGGVAVSCEAAGWSGTEGPTGPPAQRTGAMR